MNDYRAFIEAKIKLDPGCGFAIDPASINQALKPFTREVVRWMLQGGRRAFFGSFGLHKTVTQLEVMRQLGKRETGRPRLIVCPLGVRGEFKRDAARFFTGDNAIDLRFVRTTAEIDDTAPIWITNYESVREGKIDPTGFDVSLDEASILRGLGGTKTFREFMKAFEHTEGYRFVATATPSPNEYIELLAYSAFLGVMDVGQAKTRFFKRDAVKADKLTLHPHKVREFWLWLSQWALFVNQPSDLGAAFTDDGYVLPPLEVRWHKLPTDHRMAGVERDGQEKMFKDAAAGVVEASREKRASILPRVAKVAELARAGEGQAVIWADLNDEQKAIGRALVADGATVSSLTGSQDIDDREVLLEQWRDRETDIFLSKPMMYGAGVNLQQAHRMIFAGINFKAQDLLQAIHRIHRFGQERPCTVDIVYTEAEIEVRRELERKWQQHDAQVRAMTDIIREFGLSNSGMAAELQRSIGTEREEAGGRGWTMVKNDCVIETGNMESDSVDLIVTSIPFSTQYEYSPSYNDFGHSDDNEHFFQQMGFLIPNLLRVLKPGRDCAIHVKDRITPGGINGFGFQTVEPFSDQTIAAFTAGGFAFLCRKTIGTDVVRENNQTYRLGWSEQCKDGTRMGAGMPEYVLLFRKPPSDRSNGYADTPVKKDKPLVYVSGNEGETQPFDRAKRPVPGTGYSRGRWQLDANGVHLCSGDRLLLPDELTRAIEYCKRNRDNLSPLFKAWKKWALENVYSHDLHVAFGEELDRVHMLPPDFSIMPVHSTHPDIWTDITRMRTLNGAQQAKGREMHLCPLQFDVADRLITQLTMKGELVYDPFAGIGTVPLRALMLSRVGLGCELSRAYWLDAQWHLRAAEAEANTPSLFDTLSDEPAPAIAAVKAA